MWCKSFKGDLSFTGGIRFLFILFIIISSSGFGVEFSSSDKAKKKYEADEYIPKPKTITRTICEIKNGEIISERKLSYSSLEVDSVRGSIFDRNDLVSENDFFVKLNEDGNKQENKNLNHKTGIEKNILYFYTDSLLTSTIHLNKYKDTVAVWCYKYDEKGNLIEEVENKSQRFERAKWQYQYDENSNLVKADFFRNGTHVKSNLFNYENYECNCNHEGCDKNNCQCIRVEKVVQRVDGKITKRSIFKYDCMGKLLEEIVYNKKGENNLIVENKYNQYGYKSECYYKRKDKTDLLIRYDYEYYN